MQQMTKMIGGANQAPSTPSGGKTTDLSFTARLVNGLKYIVSGADTVPFGPLQPMAPVFQEPMQGRQWDYQTGLNLNYVPRQNEPVSFQQLRDLADNYDLLRLAIETRKDQLCKINFRAKPKDKAKKEDARCKEVDDFFSFPDQEHDWNTWLRMLLDDLFVLDAPTIYPRKTKGGKLFALEPMDGALIKRVIDAQGRTPVPPEVAYQQYIKGVPAVDYSRDELIYLPRNLRTNRLYGYSPVEQVMMTVNIALRRQLHQLQYYTEGSTPDLLFFCPETWNPDQIRQFQELWDGLMIGQTGTRRQGKFLPNGITPYDVKQTALKDEYDEWLARIICFAFSLPPTALVKQMNRATSETAKETANEEGLASIVSWCHSLRNIVIWKHFGYMDLESTVESESDIDPLIQAQIDKIYLQEYVVSPDDVRERLGLEGAAPVKPLPPALGQPTGGNDGTDGNSGNSLPIDSTGGGGRNSSTDKNGTTTDGKPTPSGKKKVNNDTFRIERAKKKIQPLDRNRGMIVDTRDDLSGTIVPFLALEGERLAEDILDGIKADKTAADITASLSFEPWSKLIQPVSESSAAIYQDGVKEAFAQISVVPVEHTVNLLNERAVAYADKRGAELVGMRNIGTKENPEWVTNPDAKWSITETTRDNLNDLVTKAMSTDTAMGPNELRQAIIDSESFSISRADMIARTELAFADVAGNMAAYRASGVVVGKYWLLGSEHPEYDECDTNADEGTIGIDDLFSSGDDAPPQHPNCECDVIPVTIDEMDSE